MSNKPKMMMNPLAHMDGARVPGGCDHCEAYTDIDVTSYGAAIHVRHDDDCPFLLSLPVLK